MKVLLLYDHRTREKYRAHLIEMVHDAGGTIAEVDAGSGTYNIPERFEAEEVDADVVLIDLTVPNFNIGYEVGRFLRRKDDRLLAFSFSPQGFPDALPFYLTQERCFSLNAVLLDRPKGKQQRLRLVNEIRAVGARKASAPLDRYQCTPASDAEARAFFTCSKSVYRAPGAAFLFGEFAVTVGHPALHLPLPRYVYVGVTPRSRGQVTRVRCIRPGAGSLDESYELHSKYQHMLGETLKVLGSPPLEVLVWSQLPTMCGLGTSSAISACLALHLLGHGQTPLPQVAPTEPGVTDLLRPGSNMERAFKLAWKLDAAFHSYLGSGAGVCASLAGALRANPVLYFSEARKVWQGDTAEYPWELGTWHPDRAEITVAHGRIDKIRCFAFPLVPREGSFKRGHFALIYTGHPKSTGAAMANVRAMATYFLDRSEMVKPLVTLVSEALPKLRYPLTQRISDAYQTILHLAVSAKNPEQVDL
jgi:GHMP kinases N terminal domain